MEQRWIINRIGLVNFWCYDEEEFVFEQGKLLLRGANGSGKSVTMQSFIPLLLDGNKSPGRLDPFGSKARKLDYYLIEEGSGIDERTGYLYMEFKRGDTDTYLSMGMGLRARAGKPLDSWYFTITDNRRIGKDIFVYKTEREGGKTCCTKNELRSVIGEGGTLVDKQSEYMDMVNRQLFGFAGLDEYKEMITLLVQLRTPKLSKEFTPSIISQILDESLQTLTEEDLRPMSEAIENMDAIKANLDHMEECRKTVDKVMQVYDQYNKIVLLEKSKKYIELYQLDARAQSNVLNLEKEGEELAESLKTAIETECLLKEEWEKLEAKKQDLEKNDAVAIKENTMAYEEEIKRQREHIAVKSRELEGKQSRQTDIEGEIKNKKAEEEQIRQEITWALDEMQELGDEMNFAEHGLMSAELKKAFGEPFAFDYTRKSVTKAESDLKDGVTLLTRQKAKEDEFGAILQRYDIIQQNKEKAETDAQDAEEKAESAKAELIESLQEWALDCSELYLPKESLDKLLKQVAGFTVHDRYFDGKQIVAEDYSKCKNALEKRRVSAEVKHKSLVEEKREKERQLAELETAEEIAPPRDEATLGNRKRLSDLGIPFMPFYRLIDFKKDLPEGQASRIEEALLHMGILDALVVPEEYKVKVLAEIEGCADKYIFAKHRLENSLEDVLVIDKQSLETYGAGEADRLLLKQLEHALRIVGFESREGSTRISRNGGFGIGVIRGTVSGLHQAKYVGEQARRRNRLQAIENCKKELEVIFGKIDECEADIDEIGQRLIKLASEYEAIPKDAQLVAAMGELLEREKALSSLKAECETVKDEKEKVSVELDSIKSESASLAKKLSLQAKLDVFENAYEAAAEYKDLLNKLELQYNQFRAAKEMRETKQGQYDELEEDLDNIRYDLGVAERAERELAGKIDNCREQLELSGYEEIREELDFCLERLKQIAAELELFFNAIGQNEANIEQNKKQVEAARAEMQGQKIRCELMAEALEAEIALGYVQISGDLQRQKKIEAETETGTESEAEAEMEQNSAMTGATEDRSKDLLRYAKELYQAPEMGKVAAKDRDDVQNSVQKHFFESVQQLSEYNMSLGSIFEDKEELPDIKLKRIDITCKLRGRYAKLHELAAELADLIENQKNLLRDSDREIFEDILTNTLSRKISDRIFRSEMWVKKINELMQSMSTSSGLTLSLSWRSKKAESADQLGANELVELLKKDPGLMRDEDIDKLAGHFRSKINEARKRIEEQDSVQTFHTIMKEVLDYRKWFEFQIYYKKTGKERKILTNREFFTFSGGEKAMAMYVPLFSAVTAKYQGARDDAPRLVSLDEAFAGVDDMNIKDMFRLMEEFGFSYIINSQVLWGDYETVPGLSIYQLYRPDNAEFVTAVRYVWNGTVRRIVIEEEDAQQTMLFG